MHELQSLVAVTAGPCNCEELSSFNGVCRRKYYSTNKRKRDGQRELQEEAGKSKRRSIALYKFCGFMGWKKIAGEQIFSNLAVLMKSLLFAPHSNSSCERSLYPKAEPVCPMTVCARF